MCVIFKFKTHYIYPFVFLSRNLSVAFSVYPPTYLQVLYVIIAVCVVPFRVIYIYIYTHIYIYVYMYIHMYIMFICAYPHNYVCIHVYASVFLSMCARDSPAGLSKPNRTSQDRHGNMTSWFSLNVYIVVELIVSIYIYIYI